MPAVWTQESKEYLINCWGTVSISRLSLGPFLNNGDYITVNQLFNAIGRGNGRSYTLNSWINKGLPVKRKK